MTWSIDLTTSSSGDPSIALVSEDTGFDLRSALSVAQGIQAMMTEDSDQQMDTIYPDHFTADAVLESFVSDANQYELVRMNTLQPSEYPEEGYIRIADKNPDTFEASLIQGEKPDLFEGLIFVRGTVRLYGSVYLVDAFDPFLNDGVKTYRVEFLREAPAMPAIYRKEIYRALGR